MTLALPVEWSLVIEWTPEQRYDPVGTQTFTSSGNMIAATRKLVRGIL